MKIAQAVEILNRGDAVGNDVRALHRALQEEGYNSFIHVGLMNETLLAQGVKSFSELDEYTEDDIVFLHVATSSPFNYKFARGKYRKVIIYHNTTPPFFFRNYDMRIAYCCRNVLNEVRFLADKVDFAIADSDFNRNDLVDLGYKCPIFTVPILIPFEDYRRTPSEHVLKMQREKRGTKLLFVGRVVPNKCIEDVIAVFAQFRKYYDKEASLTVVGSYSDYDKYVSYLRIYMDENGIADRVHFTCHISFEEILAYYATADVFLCQSEHEGFCVPLVEAMLFDLPVVAYASTAIPYTLASSGILLKEKDPLKTAGVINYLMSNDDVRQSIIDSQRKRLEDFEYRAVKSQFIEVLEKMIKE